MTKELARAVFLDRDGVLNRIVMRDGKPYAPLSLDELELYPETEDAVERLRMAGLVCIVVTNQPDIARGTLAPHVVEAMHEMMRNQLSLDDFIVCGHDDVDGCDCRKPLPGMLHQGARRLGIDLSASFLVGDRWKDIDAGKAVGCVTLWIDRGYDERRAEDADYTVTSLGEAVSIILSRIG